MYEDTPQELVHDLISEAVFGRAPARAARRRDGEHHLLDQPRRSMASYHRAMYVARQHRRRGGRQPRARAAARRCSSSATEKATEGPRRPIRSPLVRAPPPGLRFQSKETEQYHVCLGAPGISRSDRRRFVVSLLDAILGGLGVVAALPGDPREAGDGVLGLQLRLAVHGHGPGRPLRGDARGEPARRASTIAVEQILEIASGNLSARRAGASQGEPQEPDHALDGVDVEPHVAARQVAHHQHRDPVAAADHRRDRGGRRPRRWRSSPRCCSLRSGSRPPASARARTASCGRSSASSRRSSLARRRMHCSGLRSQTNAWLAHEFRTVPCVAAR